ncbi:MAG: PEP-CTERM sorting domain-containing protein [Planctomycetota bacterium]|nr:PEP-CTERM sorting domain-containing protein [Planctomycetota bacterium]
MRTKLALMFAVLVGLGSVRADVTGIALSSTGTTGASTLAATTLQIQFTTSSGGASFGLTSLKLTNASNAGDNVGFSFDSGFASTTNIDATVGSGVSTFDFVGAGFNQTLAASTSYTLYVRNLLTTTYSTTTSSSLTSGTAPLNFTGTAFDSGSGNYANFELSASVPEPATLILTGSALAAGAVGAYFKRRRKVSTEIAA